MDKKFAWHDGLPPEDAVPNPSPMAIIFPGRSGPIIEIIGATQSEMKCIDARIKPILRAVTDEMNASRAGPYESVGHAMNRYVEIMTAIYRQQEHNVTIAVLKSVEQNPEFHIFSKGDQGKKERENVYLENMLPRVLMRARNLILTEERPDIMVVSMVLSQSH